VNGHSQLQHVRRAWVLALPALVILLAVVGMAFSPAAQAAPPSYRLARADTLGGDGFWDCLACDQAGGRIFIARQDRIMVVDEAGGKLLGEIKGFDRAHGIAFDYASGRGFATSGGDSAVVMFDLKTLKVLGRIPAEPDADIILYDPATKRIFTMNGDSRNSTVIDPAAGKRIGTIQLGASPEFAVADGAGKLYANLADSSEVAEIDAAAMKVTRRWSIAPGRSPTGLAYDPARHLLFSACRDSLLIVSDAVAGKMVGKVPIGGGVDGCAFDPALGLAFAPCGGGTGTLALVQVEGPDRFSVLANVPTRRGARTIALDEKSHRVFTVTAGFGPTPPPTKEQPRPRPKLLPGTFTLLTLEPVK